MQPDAADRRIAQALVPLLATWPDEGMPPERLRAYALVLADLEPDVLQAAVAQCLSTCRFFPKPAEIRQAAVSLKTRARGLPSAGEAWAELVEQIERVGHYNQPTFSNPQIEQALRHIGGWSVVCLSENPQADRARFLQAYEALERRELEDGLMLPAVRQQVAALADRLASSRRLPAPVEATE